MNISLYQIFLKSKVYQIVLQVKRPGNVWNRETIFDQKKNEKNNGNFATVAVKFTSLNSKIAEYGSDFTNFENIAKIKKYLSI